MKMNPKEIRQWLGVSQTEMGLLVGCKLRAVQYYEKGRIPKGEIYDAYNKFHSKMMEGDIVDQVAKKMEPLFKKMEDDLIDKYFKSFQDVQTRLQLQITELKRLNQDNKTG